MPAPAPLPRADEDAVTLHLLSEFVGPGDRVLLMDDVLATGKMASALIGAPVASAVAPMQRACCCVHAASCIVHRAARCVLRAYPQPTFPYVSAELIRKSGATLVGCGFLIDKAYEKGREVLPKDAMIHSLVSIQSVQDSVIHFEGALAL